MTGLWPEDCGIAAFGGEVLYAAYRRQRCRRQRKPNNRACGALEMHPYSRYAGLLLKGSMSLDSQVASLSYESSSFATPEGEVCSLLSLGTHKYLKA